MYIRNLNTAYFAHFFFFRKVAEFKVEAESCLESSLDGCSMRYSASIKLLLERLAKCEVKLGKIFSNNIQILMCGEG